MNSAMHSTLRVAIVGPGRLGMTLAVRYAELQAEVHLIGRRAGAWQSRAQEHGIQAHLVPVAREIPALSGLDLWLFCVPDDALAACAQDWANACTALQAPQLVLHTSGAADLEVLNAWQASQRAAVHPMRVFAGQALQGNTRGAPLRHELEAAPVSVQGNTAEATERASLEVERWGAEAVRFETTADRRRYHLACCLAANHLTALFAWAEELAGPAIGSAAARRGLSSLAASVLERVQELGPDRALTGPVARGDALTIQAHFAALSVAEAARYRALLPELLGFAQASGALSAERASEFAAQFGLSVAEPGQAE